MKSLIKRLKKETGDTYEQAWKQGASVGQRWAFKYARQCHLRQIGEEELTFDSPKSNAMSFLRFHYPGPYFQTPEDERADYEDEIWGDPEAYWGGFNRGFAETVQSLWKQIKSKL